MKIADAGHLGLVARQRRLDVDWSQRRLADAAGVSRQWVSAFEHGKETVELGVVLRVLRVLGLFVEVAEYPPDRVNLGSLVDG